IILDAVDNPHLLSHYLVRFTCPEFTSLCLVTEQPDFAHIIIDYVPDRKIVESKSIKLYLMSYRNYKTFHEGCATRIGMDIIHAIDPKWLRVTAMFYPRGGIPLDVCAVWGKVPNDVLVPELPTLPYRGR